MNAPTAIMSCRTGGSARNGRAGAILGSHDNKDRTGGVSYPDNWIPALREPIAGN